MTKNPSSELKKKILEEFRMKLLTSWARGGFLTTDADSSWEVDKGIAHAWLNEKFDQLTTQVEAETLGRVKEEITKMQEVEQHPEHEGSECSSYNQALNDLQERLTKGEKV